MTISWVLLAMTLMGAGADAAQEPAPAALPPLVQRLGFAADARVLILNGDDFGMNHATNEATMAALQSGGLTSATIMVPCPWFPEAARFARDHPQANLGLHLTLTSEWGRYKWGPVSGRSAVPGLVDRQGYFYENVFQVYASAKMEEVDTEVRAQLDKALDAGIDVTHIDSHMGALQYNPKYHEVYIKIAKDYNLPCRMAGRDLMTKHLGGYLIDMADELGVVHPDFLHMGEPETLEDTERYWKEIMGGIAPGAVTELYIHCGQETPEMEATTGSYRRRTADAQFFSRPETIAWIQEQGIELVSYRELRHLQREGAPMPRAARYGWE